MTLRVTPADIVADAESSGRPGLLVKAPSWGRVPLGEVARVVNGAPYDSSRFNVDQRGMPLVRIRDVGARRLSTWYDGEWDELQRVRRGDLLIGMDGNFTIDQWHLSDALLNQRVCRLDVDDSRMDRRFLELALQGYLDAIWNRTSSTTVKHLSSKTIAQIPLPAAPINEQRRIVKILEEHLTRLDAGADATRVAAARGASLREATLQATVGVLQTPLVPLGALLEVPLSNGRSVKDRAGGFPVLRLTSITSGRFDDESQKEGDWTAAEARRYLVRKGDFLCARGNGSRSLVGAGALVQHDPKPVAFPDTIIRVRPDATRLNARYLSAVWGSRRVRVQIENRAKTTAGIYKVNQSDLAGIMIALPHLSVQKSIALQLERVDDEIDRLERQASALLLRSASLRRALLQAAFSGQLTGRASDLDRAEELVS